VNLSDMAAVGAAPRWALGGALPQVDTAWLAASRVACLRWPMRTSN
jgi:thiamine monophosphate kinase